MAPPDLGAQHLLQPNEPDARDAAVRQALRHHTHTPTALVATAEGVFSEAALTRSPFCRSAFNPSGSGSL